MNHQRRRFLHLAVGAAALLAMPRVARAQAYPTRPVRIIVGFPAGGATDLAARLMGQWLSDRLGQPFIIENRPGGGTNIAAEALVRAQPDGYTLLVVGPSYAINATLYDKLNFNFLRDTTPVAGVIRSANVMVANLSVPARTVPEFIAYAKANPGKVNMASAGIGSIGHMSGELFKLMAGVDMLHVPYRGDTPALQDLIGGRVQVYFSTVPGAIEHIKAGTLRTLAVTTASRTEVLPDVPTIGDFVPGYEATLWYGISAPRNTPANIVDGLNREINAALADAKMRSRLADLGASPMSFATAAFGKLVADETEKWGKVIRAANIKPE
jgi:tripartite-type tricarboxylate transporter receptor subunit TctC